MARFNPAESMRSPFAASANEIAADPALRIFGAFLSVIHVLTYVFWVNSRNIAALLAGQLPPLCWPFFENCFAYRILSLGQASAVLYCYLAVSVSATALFLAPRKYVPLAYGALIFLTLFKLALFVQDYSLRMNQHYMALAATLAYLFVPGKRALIKQLLVLFYFWASTLKFNQEWLSGAALYRLDHLWIPKPFHGLSFAYVVVLEAIFSWALLSRNAWVFGAAFAQFLLFHLFSWSLVGFFYPLVMYSLLSLFVLDRVFPPAEPPALAIGGSGPGALYLAAFSALQLVPLLFPGDVTLTGEGRYFSLNMFDAKSVCVGSFKLSYVDGHEETVVPVVKTEDNPPPQSPREIKLPARIHCDPLVYFNWAKGYCRRKDIKELNLRLSSRRNSSPNLKPVIDIDGFCGRNLRYSMLFHNDWIIAE